MGETGSIRGAVKPPVSSGRSCQDAIFGARRRYRYVLRRRWNEELPGILFILLNPSTANGSHDDPTLRRCQAFARYFGAGSLTLVNLFALRATDPAELRRSKDPIGVDNDAHIVEAASRASRIVAGWGNLGSYLGRDRQVLTLVRTCSTVECLGITANGSPRHPLYIAGRTPAIPYA